MNRVKISDYNNYEIVKTQAEVDTFKETGVLLVSGKYTDNGKMTTKNVKPSDLVGGGGASVPTPTSSDVGKVLTVDNSERSEPAVTIPCPLYFTVYTLLVIPIQLNHAKYQNFLYI